MKLFAFLILPILLVGCAGSQYSRDLDTHRRAYKEKHLANERGPLTKKTVRWLDFYPADESYRVDCAFTPTPGAEPFDMATYSGQTRPYVQHGTVECPLPDTSITLAIYRNLTLSKMPQYRDHLFLPFHDATNGDATYGGGRYLNLSVLNIEEDRITIDFNHSYNPYCAYTDGYSCPIPPRANHLEVAIPVGERIDARFAH